MFQWSAINYILQRKKCIEGIEDHMAWFSVSHQSQQKNAGFQILIKSKVRKNIISTWKTISQTIIQLAQSWSNKLSIFTTMIYCSICCKQSSFFLFSQNNIFNFHRKHQTKVIYILLFSKKKIYYSKG